MPKRQRHGRDGHESKAERLSVADKFRTQNGPLMGSVRYVLHVPANLWFISEVSDLLFDMTQPDNWEQVGDVTVDDASQAASTMWEAFQPMTGELIPFVTATVPEGLLLCDGSTYNRVDYPDLYDALDSAFIIDADTFNVPNMIDRMPVGAGGDYAIGDVGGEKEHTLTQAEMPSHSHSYGGTLLTSTVVPPPLDGTSPNPIPAATGNTGGDGAHNNMPPYLGVKWGIAT